MKVLTDVVFNVYWKLIIDDGTFNFMAVLWMDFVVGLYRCLELII